MIRTFLILIMICLIIGIIMLVGMSPYRTTNNKFIIDGKPIIIDNNLYKCIMTNTLKEKKIK